MYVCMCNPFSDRDVKAHLDEQGCSRTTVSSTYRACSGGESPECCSCIDTLKTMVIDHNNRQNVAEMVETIEDDIKEAADQEELETV